MSATLRAEVIKQLVTIMSDDTLLPDERIERVFADDIDATAAERFAAAKVLAKISNDGLTELGLVDPPTEVVRYKPVLAGASDTTMGQLRAIAAVWGVLARWDVSLHLDRRLGDVMKVLPAEDRDLVLRLLGVEELS